MAGYRSLLAFWVGGASSITPTTTGGIKSLLAPWTGGAATAPVTTTAGYRSLLGFWVGGGFAGTEQLIPITPSGGGSSYARWPQQPRYNDDEEVLMLGATAFMHILDMEGES